MMDVAKRAPNAMLPFVPAIVEAVLKVRKQTNKQTTNKQMGGPFQMNKQTNKRAEALTVNETGECTDGVHLPRGFSPRRVCREPLRAAIATKAPAAAGVSGAHPRARPNGRVD